MSTYTMNMSEEIFRPDARQFNPERWMKPDSKQLAEQIYTFSKGSRMYIGIKSVLSPWTRSTCRACTNTFGSLANVGLVILIARLLYNLNVFPACSFKGLVEREHFTVSYAPHGVQFDFEAK